MNKQLQATIRSAFAAAGPPPTMRGRVTACGVGVDFTHFSIHFSCDNLEEVETYVRRVAEHAPHIVVTVAHRAVGHHRLMFEVDSDCPGLPGGPVHRAHLRVGLSLARRAFEACLEARRGD